MKFFSLWIQQSVSLSQNITRSSHVILYLHSLAEDRKLPGKCANRFRRWMVFFVKHFSVFQYSKRMRTSRIVWVTETSCHYDLGKNNRHKTEGGDGTEEKSIGEEQFRFMLGRGTTDAIFAARRVIEKHREMQKEMHLVFIDLVKAYRVPRPEV